MPLTHEVTWEQVRDRAGLRPGAPGTPDATAVEVEAKRLLALAVGDLEEALVGAFRTPPLAQVNECVLSVARAYADRRRTQGNAQNGVEDAQLRQVPRDPLAAVRPILARYALGLA